MLTNSPSLNDDHSVASLAPVMERLKDYSKALVIRTDAEYATAANQLKTIKGALAEIEDARTRITKPLNESLKETNAQAKSAAAPFQAQEQVIKAAMISWSNEQDRLREIEQRKANEAAEKERRRLQAIADEAARKAREQADEKRRQAEQAAAAGRAEEAAKLAAQASRIDAKAEEKVEHFEMRAAQVVAPVAQQAAPKVGGISIPMVWVHEIVDAALIPREYLDVNETRIRKVVQAMQGNTNIPGVRVRQIKRVAAGVA